MNVLRRFFSQPKNLLIVLSAITGLVLLAIIAVVVGLIAGDEQESRSSGGGTSIGKGTVSSLSGGTASYRNLKGLTLRINQIDTCNPSQLSAYVSVSSEQGQVNKNFGKSDVKVYFDGEKVASFEFSSVDTNKLPLANMLTIDHSGSMTGAPIANAKSAAISYVDQLKSADQVGVVQFDDRIELLAEVSPDKAKARSVIEGISPRGDTAVYDALSRSIESVPNCGRKAVTILTDGTDTASKISTEQSVIDAANKTNLPIFAVGVKSDGFDPSSIRSISEKTGGQYLEANTPDEIAAIYKKIDSQLTGQFALNLKLNVKKDGSTHTLKIISNVEGSETGSERVFVY